MSKANQKFVQADEAVSPVIGVILMVAITVVLAAVVFVLVSNLGEGSEAAPDMGFTADDTAATATVVRAPPLSEGLLWGTHIVIAGDCAPANAGVQDGQAVDAGDVIDCASGDSLTVTHVQTNTLLYSHTFP